MNYKVMNAWSMLKVSCIDYTIQYLKDLKTMKALQLVVVLLLSYAFSHFIYTFFIDTKPVTPEAKEKLIKEACDNNKISSIDCLDYEGKDYEELYK